MALEESQDETTSLYRYFSTKPAQQLLYVGISFSALVRAYGHKRDSEWFATAQAMTVEHFPTREAALAAEREAIQKEKPLYNIAHAACSPKLKKIAMTEALRPAPAAPMTKPRILTDPLLKPANWRALHYRRC